MEKVDSTSTVRTELGMSLEGGLHVEQEQSVLSWQRANPGKQESREPDVAIAKTTVSPTLLLNKSRM